MFNSNPNLDRWLALASISVAGILSLVVLSGYTWSGKIELPNGLKADWRLAPPQSHQLR